MRFRWTYLSLAVAALVLAPIAHADDGPDEPPNEVDEKARALFVEGDREYAEGDYESALTAFEQAYALSGRHALLFNMANAHERLGEYEKALDKLRKFLPHASDDQRELLEKRMRRLEDRVDTQTVPPDEPKPVEPVPPKQPPVENGVQKPNKPATTTVAIDDEPAPPYLGYGLIGVGALGLGLGTYFGMQALDARSTAEDRCPSVDGSRLCTTNAQDAIDRDKRNSLAADISIGAGIVSAAVGVLLVLTHGNADRETNTATRFVVAPRTGGGDVDVVVRF